MVEARFLIEKYKTYAVLEGDIKTIELLFSLSIFHKRVIANLDGAIKFYGTVVNNSNADTIQIGQYNLTNDEKNKILAVVMNYNQLLERYSLSPIFMESDETRDFLKKIIVYKSILEDAEKDKKRPKGKKGKKNDQNDVPF